MGQSLLNKMLIRNYTDFAEVGKSEIIKCGIISGSLNSIKIKFIPTLRSKKSSLETYKYLDRHDKPGIAQGESVSRTAGSFPD